MKIEGHIAILDADDRYALGLPESYEPEFVGRLPIATALTRNQEELAQLTDVGDELSPSGDEWTFPLRYIALQWKQRRLQELAAEVAAFEVESYLKGKS